MMGILVLILLGLWGWFAIWLGKLLSRTLFARFTTNATTGEATKKGGLITLLLIACVLLLPVLDQLIAYPKWQQLCATTGDFEWGPGMDEKKAYGKVVFTTSDYHQISIFPNVEVGYFDWNIFDADTNQLIFRKPHYYYNGARAFLYLPTSSGSKSAFLLQPCKDSKFMTKEDYLLDQLNLTKVEK